MSRRIVMLVAVLGTMFLTTGCQHLFVSHQTSTDSRWQEWAQITRDFNNISPGHTTVNDLKRLGFDPEVCPNIKIMPYVDIVPIFMPNPNIHFQDLPIGVRVYVEAKQGNLAYLVELQNIKEKRHGNLVLDVFGFKRQTHTSGWCFKGIILIKDNTVVYTLASGEPDISKEENNLRPLGPFQDLSDTAMHLISAAAH